MSNYVASYFSVINITDQSIAVSFFFLLLENRDHDNIENVNSIITILAMIIANI